MTGDYILSQLRYNERIYIRLKQDLSELVENKVAYLVKRNLQIRIENIDKALKDSTRNLYDSNRRK